VAGQRRIPSVVFKVGRPLVPIGDMDGSSRHSSSITEGLLTARTGDHRLVAVIKAAIFALGQSKVAKVAKIAKVLGLAPLVFLVNLVSKSATLPVSITIQSFIRQRGVGRRNRRRNGA
jgi:hypothetical protein